MILESLDITAEQFAAGTGWAIKPEGACKAEVCVPLGRSAGFDLAATAERLAWRWCTTRTPGCGRWARSRSATGRWSARQAPELVLDDVDGTEFRLSSLRGQKVVLVSWAPY